jgi:signal peptidase I
MTHLSAPLLADMLKESMARGLTPNLTLTSNSMSPLLRAGDQVQIEAADPATLQIGDIVTLVDRDNSAQLLTHRFWGARAQAGEVELVTRGDRPLLFDAPLPAHKLVGRVTARRRGAGRLALRAGMGQRLNQFLARLAGAELRWLTGLDEADWVRETAVANARAAQQQTRLPVRLLRKTLLLATTILVACVGQIASRKSS